MNTTIDSIHCIRCADGCVCEATDPNICIRCVKYGGVQYYLNKTTNLCDTVCKVDPGTSKQFYKDMDDAISPSCN